MKDFPVTWENAADAGLFWVQHRLMYPHPVSPLFGSLGDTVAGTGYARAAAAMELPIVGPRFRLINTYMYATMRPYLAPPAEMAARAGHAQQKLMTAMIRLRDQWEHEYLPEVKEHLSYFRAFDLAGASMPELQAHLNDAVARQQRLWEIHFLVSFTFMIAPSEFADLYRELFSNADVLEPFRLLQGFDNMSLKASRALWRLGQEALAEPTVVQVLATENAGQALATLGRFPAGQSFLREVNEYLAEYGQAASTLDVSHPAEAEDPSSSIATLQDYCKRPQQYVPAELAVLAEDRERLVSAALARLAGYPQPVTDRFQGLLQAAQAATVVQEDHHFYIDGCAMYQLRRVLLECGRRLADAGSVDEQADVFMLTFAELQVELAAPSGHAGSLRRLVAERRAEMAHFAGIPAPPSLGTPPPGAPPENPFTRANAKFFGGPPPAPDQDLSVLTGTAAAHGTVIGPVRVVLTLADAAKVQPGDILVAPTTTPAWTSLFATAAAVVTDVGGVLCHCAVVAREYRIPAVVGTLRGTAVLRDGQLVEVNGGAGVVRLL